MWNKVQETVKYLQNHHFQDADFGIILGSGLGGFVADLDILQRLSYKDIPNFPKATVMGHLGNLILAHINKKKVIIMQGRFHYYEGWTMDQVTFPVRVLKLLGVQKLIVTNASGGVNPTYKVGDMMLITDHINLLPVHPLRGKNEIRFGPRFVDMHEPYSMEMNKEIAAIAKKKGLLMHQGVYLGLQGPTFETPAEYKMIRILGADAVGMSTVPEVIVAKHMNMDCLGLSIITDLGIEGQVNPVSHEEVQKAAMETGKRMSSILYEFIANHKQT